MYSAVNVLTNSPNILDLTKADFFQLKVSHIAMEEYVITVNVLTNSPNILDLTKADFFQLNLSQIHGKIG